MVSDKTNIVNTLKEKFYILLIFFHLYKMPNGYRWILGSIMKEDTFHIRKALSTNRCNPLGHEQFFIF